MSTSLNSVPIAMTRSADAISDCPPLNGNVVPALSGCPSGNNPRAFPVVITGEFNFSARARIWLCAKFAPPPQIRTIFFDALTFATTLARSSAVT